ncbi:hypothetical protein [Proteus mirabilis]|uniref:hypothetical protein n=1 Tax=Proteus mirabilis TaxID=584 RepID=UPI000D94C87F|nr:hypothetical protein [Proteus mirabilis]ELB1205491.1 hypothetical protein [Proteus mirabilis]MBI6260647.1 hypothetical protein [Proteus mirabilis]SPY42742.1 Uncharacterised protein [Proteus mirabilis]HEI9805960.1 hypothetical protein [Proteus mirabilis]HEK0450520.1 hypothetical protein [Proteus mirabilis]
MTSKEMQKILLAAVEVAENIEKVLSERGLTGKENDVIDILKAACEQNRFISSSSFDS